MLVVGDIGSERPRSVAVGTSVHGMPSYVLGLKVSRPWEDRVVVA